MCILWEIVVSVMLEKDHSSLDFLTDRMQKNEVRCGQKPQAHNAVCMA